MSLFRTAAKGSIQNFTIRTTTFVINFVGALILARFILPEDFGKYVIFQTYLSILFLFAFNFGQSCIYHQRLKNVFNIGLILTIIFIIVIILISILLIYFMNFFHLIDFLSQKLILLLVLSNSFNYFNDFLLSYLENYFKFLKSSLVFFISNLIGILAGIFFALNDYGLLSLIYKEFICSIVAFIILFFFYRIRFNLFLNLNKDDIKKIFNYSFSVFTIDSLNIISNRIPYLYLSLLNINNFIGLLNRSKYLSEIPKAFIEPIAGQIVLPILKKTNKIQFNKAINFFIYWTTRLAIPIGIVLFFYPKELLELLLGKNWSYAYKILQGLSVYCIASMIRPALHYSILSIGETKRLAKINLVSLIFLLFCFTSLFFFKISFYYTPWILSLNSILILIYTLKVLYDVKVKIEFINIFFYPLIISFISIIFLNYLNIYFIYEIIIFLNIYCLGIFLTSKGKIIEIIHLLKSQ